MSTDATVNLGKSDAGDVVRLDAGRLIKTRLLVTANSGGGKSWLLRLLFEQLGRSTPLIVLDREGEFVTLRERLDLVLAGPTGDVSTDVRSASLLCRRLMERGLSAVVDMSELSLAQQREYVRAFFTTLIELPKDLWRPTFFGLDEAHLFCPEAKSGSATSTDSVINVATLGRKRGYSLIAATQRISKFHKDVAAELLNKFIGRTTLDIDQSRAATELGMNAKAAVPLLREMSPVGREGEFFAFGPAVLADGVVRFRAGQVGTTHAEAGQGRAIEPPGPSRAIADAVAELADLPRQAEAEAKDLDGLRRQLAAVTAERDRLATSAGGKAVDDLRAINATLHKAIADLRAGNRSIPKLYDALGRALDMVKEQSAALAAPVAVDQEAVRAVMARAGEQIVTLVNAGVERRSAADAKVRARAARLTEELGRLLGVVAPEAAAIASAAEPAGAGGSTAPAPAAPSRPPADGLTGPQQAILDTVLMLGVRGIAATRDTVARWLGIHPNGGSYGTNLGFLRSNGYLEGFSLTEQGRAAARPTATGPDAALAAMPDEPKRKIVRALVAAGQPLTRDQLAEAIGVHPNGGSYGTNLGYLRTMGVITSKGPIAPTEGYRR